MDLPGSVTIGQKARVLLFKLREQPLGLLPKLAPGYLLESAPAVTAVTRMTELLSARPQSRAVQDVFIYFIASGLK